MHVIKSSHNHYIKWHIQRPDRFNALGPVIGQELLDALQEIQKEDLLAKGTRMLAITAETVNTPRGPIWIAGGDLKELAQLGNKDQAAEYAQLFQDITLGLRDLPIPVVIVIDGQAIGGGVEFTLGADLRIASAKSSFHFKQTAVGLATGYGGSTFLKELVGQSRASGWLFMNKTLDSGQALREGFVHSLINSSDDVDETLNSLAEKFAKQSGEGLRAQKQMLNKGIDDLKAQLQKEKELFVEIWMNPQHKKFLEKFMT